jgi:hypothetical protein
MIQRMVRTDFPGSALKAKLAHPPRDSASSHLETLPPHLPPDLAHAIDGEVLGENTGDLGREGLVPSRRIAPLDQPLAVGGRGDRQDLADGLAPVSPSMLPDQVRDR